MGDFFLMEEAAQASLVITEQCCGFDSILWIESFKSVHWKYSLTDPFAGYIVMPADMVKLSMVFLPLRGDKQYIFCVMSHEIIHPTDL